MIVPSLHTARTMIIVPLHTARTLIVPSRSTPPAL